MIIELPWPDKNLSPNARVHWAVKHKHAKKAREAAYFLTPKNEVPAGDLFVNITFHRPANYRYDRDNLQARMKPFLDGIADKLGIDDVRFVPFTNPRWGDNVKGGKVVVEIKAYEW